MTGGNDAAGGPSDGDAADARRPLLFDIVGHSDPPGGPGFDQNPLSAFPARVIWLGQEPFSDAMLLRAISLVIPIGSTSLTEYQLGSLVRWLDHGGAVTIRAPTDDAIDAVAATIHRMTGSAGHA